MGENVDLKCVSFKYLITGRLTKRKMAILKSMRAGDSTFLGLFRFYGVTEYRLFCIGVPIYIHNLH